MLYSVNSFSKVFSYCMRMASAASIERVKQNADLATRTIIELKNELNNLNDEYNNLKAQQLREENAKLVIAVEEARKKLIRLEVANNVKQIPLPQRDIDVKEDNTNVVVSTSEINEDVEAVDNLKNAKSKKIDENVPKVNQAKKEKKPKEKAPQVEEPPVDVGRLDLRVAKIEDVQRHPDADTLYILKINCGEEKSRTVCSGLVKHVPIEELKDRFVMLLCNLKPVKMRGITSEAMVMCASSPDGVEVLMPPANVMPGDLVECDGYKRQPDNIMNPKKKIFETIAPDLHTNDSREACYKGTPFNIPGKGTFTAKTMKNVTVK